MIPLSLPWLETALLVALIGAAFISRVRNLDRAWRWGVAFTGAVFACTLLASLGFYLQEALAIHSEDGMQARLFGRAYLRWMS